MADDISLLDALLAAGTVALLFLGIVWSARRILGWARMGSERAYVIGAALAPFFALGHVVDPDFRIVNEAKQQKKRDEGNPGDPPNGEDGEIGASAEARVAVPECAGSVPTAASAVKPSAWRPILARTLALLLSLLALATLFMESMIVFSDRYSAAGRQLRESFAVYEWVAMYVLSAMLLASSIELFRLKRTSVWLFGGYLCLGILLTVGHALTQEVSPNLDLRVTFVTVPVAFAMLAFMQRACTRR
jgi:hypothetical protein